MAYKTAMTTSQSLASLDPSISTFDSGISDFLVFKTGLSSTRVCHLFPFPSSVSIPQIPNPLPTPSVHPTNDHLHHKSISSSPYTPPQPRPPLPPNSEQCIAKLARKQSNLVARSELLEGAIGGQRELEEQSMEGLVRRDGTGEGREAEERTIKILDSRR
jgi:DASH complex subunit SPC19